MKRIVLKKLLNGLYFGSTLFTLSFLIIDYVLDNSLTVLPYQYTRIIIGAICLGVGFVLSTLVYESDGIPYIAKTVIQLLICTITLLIAFVISGGIPDGTGFGTGTVFVCVEISVCLVFWFVNFLCCLRDARKIKGKLLGQAKNTIS